MLKYIIPPGILALLLIVLLATQVTRMSLLEVIGGRAVPPSHDFESLSRPGSPNDFLMAPPGFGSSSPDEFSPEFPVAKDVLARKLMNIVKEMPRSRLVKHESDQFQFEQRSALFLFPDFFTIQVIALPGNTSTLAAYSGSVFGHSDLGVNRKRIEGLVEGLRERIIENKELN